jgi:tetratricopeptide (TPR) repeat protein
MKTSLLFIILLMFDTDALPAWAQPMAFVSAPDATTSLFVGLQLGLSASSAGMPSAPPDPTFFLSRGQYRSQQQDFAGALSDFNKALHLCPHNVQALAGRGYVYYQTCRYKAALIDYNHCLRLAPTNADLFYKRGLLKARLRELEAAIADFDKALALLPRHYAAQMARTYCQTYLTTDGSSLDDVDRTTATTHW